MSRSKTIISTSQKSASKLTNPFEVLSEIPIQKFCSKKLVEVEFAVPLSANDQKFFDQLIETGKKYERESNVYFISYNDVSDLTERLSKELQADLPKLIKDCSQRAIQIELEENQTSSLAFLALMTKVKMIESMYAVYSTEVRNMQQRKKIDDELNQLLKNCDSNESGDKSGKKGKGKDESKTTIDKKSKKSDRSTTKLSQRQSSQRVVNSSEIILKENEVVFDYNVDNHVLYIVLTGFSDTLIIEELTKVLVDVSVVIDVSSSNLEQPENAILKLQELFQTPKHTEYLENTVWMKYRNEGKSSPKEVLEEFLYVVKDITYIKRQHLLYTENLKLVDLGETPKKQKSECFEKYSKILNSYPIGLINVPVIISALIKDICWRESTPVYSLSDLTQSSESSEQFPKVPKQPKSYQVHEKDELKMGMKAYGEIGRKFYDESLDYLKLLQPLHNFEHRLESYYQSTATSTEEYCYCKDRKALFDYFHLAIFNQMKRSKFVPDQPKIYYLTENLVTQNQVEDYEAMLPKSHGVGCDRKTNDLVLNYQMKEDLSTSVLYQLIFKAMKDYVCWDRYYCQESEATLLRFHNNVDDFGLDVKIWSQHLRIPVCLRDFCRYVTNFEESWLKENKLQRHTELNDTDSEEECEGVKEICLSEMFPEYQYLLGTQSGNLKEKKKIFEKVLNELLDYPKSESLANHCNDDGTLLAYDLGPKVCQLTGHTTVFHSDDGMKITVDTTRFMVQDPKCTITAEADGNALVFHNNGSFHFILEDETIVNFTEFERDFPPTTKKEVLEESQSKQENASLDVEDIEEEESAQVTNYNDYWVQLLDKQKLAKLPKFSGNIYDKKFQADDKNLDRLLELFKAALFVQNPIYKVSTKRSLPCLKRKISNVQIPFVRILNRVLFKPTRKKRKIKGYSVFNNTRKNSALKYDFTITLPNGLFLSTLQRDSSLTEIKQEYKFARYKEKCRAFYSNGICVIKHHDGTATIFRSNGDIIKLTNETNECDLKCTDGIFDEEDVCPYEQTRCVRRIKTLKKTKIFDLYEFGDIPYTRQSLIKFDGRKIDVFNGKITEEQLYYVPSEHDYHADELFYEREDGMNSIVYNTGKQIYQFPDGTKITTFAEFEKEPIILKNKSINEGWVSVIVSYTFQHPDYVTVKYDQFERATQMFLKNSVVKRYQDSFKMSINRNLALKVSSDNVIFQRFCKLCNTDCACKIHTNAAPKLVEVCDSYNKHLSCDNLGKCEINSDFIKSPNNKKNCNHQRYNEKQKLFILNKFGSPGTFLWKDNFIDEKIANAQQYKNVKVSNYMNPLTKKHTIEIFTEVKQDFIGRFTMTQLHNRDICLAKYKEPKVPSVFYITYRILTDFQNLLNSPDVVEELKEFVENRRSSVSSKVEDGIKQLLIIDPSTAQEKLSYRMSVREIDPPKIEVPDSGKAQEIIAKWRKTCTEYKHLIRKKIFPPYFQSDYYLQMRTKN